MLSASRLKHQCLYFYILFLKCVCFLYYYFTFVFHYIYVFSCFKFLRIDLLVLSSDAYVKICELIIKRSRMNLPFNLYLTRKLLWVVQCINLNFWTFKNTNFFIFSSDYFISKFTICFIVNK